MNTLSPRNKRLLFGGAGLLLLLILAVALLPSLFKSPPKPPEPTPAPTEAPPTVIRGYGGQIFLNVSADYLLTKYNIKVEYEAVGSFEAKNKDLSETDFVWLGSASAMDDFMRAHPGKVNDRETVFRTFETIFTRRDKYLQPLLNSGLVYGNDEEGYFIKMFPIIQAMNEGKTWKEIGIPELPGLVNIGYSAPERSSGGLQHLFLLGNYMMPNGEGGDIVLDEENLEEILPYLQRNWEIQARQDTASPEWFDTYVIKSASVPLAASSESLYIGWLNNLPEEYREDGELIVPLYPETTVSTDHVLAGLTPEGQRLVEIFRKDAYLQQLGWDTYGMRTGVGGISAIPGNATAPGIIADPIAVGEPREAVFIKVRELFQ